MHLQVQTIHIKITAKCFSKLKDKRNYRIHIYSMIEKDNHEAKDYFLDERNNFETIMNANCSVINLIFLNSIPSATIGARFIPTQNVQVNNFICFKNIKNLNLKRKLYNLMLCYMFLQN